MSKHMTYRTATDHVFAMSERDFLALASTYDLTCEPEQVADLPMWEAVRARWEAITGA